MVLAFRYIPRLYKQPGDEAGQWWRILVLAAAPPSTPLQNQHNSTRDVWGTIRPAGQGPAGFQKWEEKQGGKERLLLRWRQSSQATGPTSSLGRRDMSLLYSICMLQRIIKSQTFSTSNLRKNLAETKPWAFMAPQAAEVVGKHQRYHPQGP